jgi:AraC-like DNA-binding protein
MTFLFGEQPCVSKLYNVGLFYSKKEAGGNRFIEYNGNLYCYELIYTLCGENVTCFNGKNIVNVENTIEFLPKGIDGAPYTVDRHKNGHCIDIFFDTPEQLPQEALSFHVKDMKVKHLFEQCERSWNQKATGYYARCMSCFYEIIAVMQDAVEAGYASALQLWKIEKSIEYLKNNCCTHDFSYTTLAEVSGLSYSYFKSLFIKKNGISPSRYIANLKVARAIELLITGRYAISQIADMTGFENVYYFSTFFKKETGMSPTAYIRECRR